MPSLVQDGEVATTTAASTLAATTAPTNKTQPSARTAVESNNEKQKQTKKTDREVEEEETYMERTADVAAAPLVRRPSRVQESTNGKQKQTMQTQKQKPVTAKPKEKEKVIIPPPPPGVPEIQLRMWTATLRRRMHQLKQLSSEHLSGFANEIREDFMSSRNGSNEYSAALRALTKGRKSRESNGGGNTDFAAGRYSSLFLQENKISPESIGRHFLALFYRCIDNRLPPAMSKHGLDTLRRACASLDRWRKKLEEEKSRKRKKPDDYTRSDSRKEDENPAKGHGQVVRQDPAEPNVTTNPSSSSIADRTTHTHETTENISEPLNSTDTNRRQEEPTEDTNNITLVDKEKRNDPPKKESNMPSINSNLSRPAKPYDGAHGKGGAPSSHEVTGKVTNAKTLSSSNAGRPELRVSTNTEDTSSLTADDPPALNSCDNNNETIDTANNSPNIPAGYRRSTVRKCVVDDCPNKRGKCNLHGKIRKTCKIEGCDKFQIQGFDVCIKHGAANPKECKADGCKKQYVKNGFCIRHQELTNKSQAAIKAPVEPQLSATNEQAASAKVPPELLKRESINTHQNIDEDELIDLTADSPAKKAPPEQLASPPPSPPPTTIIRKPPPPAKPRPIPFSDFHRVLFCADNGMSGCVKENARLSTMVVEFDRGYHLDGSGGSLDNAQCVDVRQRLSTWDPYWKIVEELGHHDVECANGMTSVGTRTTACLLTTKKGNSASATPSCAMVSIDFSEEILRFSSANRDSRGRNVQNFRPWGVKWGTKATGHRQGDRRLIMRCVPLRRTVTDEKKRADLHIWPLGSFVQIKLEKGGDQVIPVVQRKQQSHDHNKWLGNSRHLDLTPYITDTNSTLDIKICSKEVIEASDAGVELKNSYAVQVAICEYTEPDVLYNQLMGEAEGGEVVMPKLSLRSSKKMLKECISNNTISLDSDEEEGDGKESESDFLTFSLLCHASKKCIETPVRGQHCTHLQCFDLRNYLNTSNVVSAGRWRCPYCEKFVSVRDLVHCGLFQEILNDIGNEIVPGVRETVCVKADGTFQLLGETKRSKKSGTKTEASGSSEAVDVELIESEGEEPEVIELL